MKELIVALDLELNQPSRSVVQIGAVLGNVRTGEVVSQFDLKLLAEFMKSEYLHAPVEF